MESSKFEKCIRLTESSNDNEALSALRIAQSLCKKYKISFVDRLLNQSQARHKDFEYLKLTFAQLSDKYEKITLKYNELHTEKTRLQQKIKSFQGSTALQAKYKKLKDEFNEIEQKNILASHQLGIFKEFCECGRSKKEFFLKKLFTKYIQDAGIKYSEKEWTSSAILYKQFIEKVCYNIKIISLKKFSQLFSLYLDIKSVKGGKKKDKMGFSVYLNR